MPPSDPETTPHQPTKFYLTTPIYYVNARPHIGHAYTTVVADVLARRHRLLGHPTFFLTGTDEHGQKIERSAAAAGVPPQQFADGVSAQFQALWDRMGLTYTRFLRTTSGPHKQGAQVLFAELFRLGHIYLSAYTGSYCVSDEAFVDLPSGTPCPDCGRPLETVTEENFFFRLSHFQLPLLNLIESSDETGLLKITPEASRNEVLSFLRGPVQAATSAGAPGPASRTWVSEPATTPEGAPSMAQSDMGGNVNLPSATPALAQTALGTPYVPGALKDLSISRSSFTWGIPVPEPAASLTKEPHVIYVWLDALANYMTAIGYGNPDPTAQAEFRKWWPADLHLVGKEITRFHCIYWPAFLLALNPATATSVLPQPTPEPEGAPSTAQPHRALGGNVSSPSATTQPTPKPEGPPSTAQPHRALGGNVSSPPATTQPTPEPEGAPSTAQPHRALGGNVAPPSATAWATPEAEWSPEEHGLPPEPNLTPATEPQGAPSMTQGGMGGNVNPQPAPADHAAWATRWLPKQITANGWLLFDNSKMSKSKGNVVRTETILDAFGTLCPPKPTSAPTSEGAPSMTQSGMGGNVSSSSAPTPHDRDLFAADVLRYYLLREIPFGQDGSFSFEALVTRYNADLANGYGNLVSRVLNMIQQYFKGELPSGTDVQALETEFPALSSEPVKIGTLAMRALFNAGASQFFSDFNDCEHSRGLTALWRAVLSLDLYITAHAPWKLAKEHDVASRSELAEILVTSADGIRMLTALLHPILPYTTAKVWAQLGLGSIGEAAQSGKLKDLQWGGLPPGTKLGPLSPIFPRADKSLAQVMTDMETTNTPSLTPITDNNDSTHPDTSPFPEAPLSSAAATTPVLPSALTDSVAPPTPSRLSNETTAAAPPSPTRSFDPAAGPRPLSPANPAAAVAGSHAITTERPGTPPHTEATPSGIFANGPIPVAPPLASTPNPDQSPEITVDDFAKIDLRVARILVCERILKADKLLRLEVDLGPDLGRRQILSGIAEHYTPESLVGRRIIVITNLAPRTMRGLESHGMLLAANGPEIDGKPGKPILATTAEDTPLGSRLK